MAAVAAAYLVDYESGMGEDFCKMKTSLVTYFQDNLIRGAVFDSLEEEVVLKITDGMIYAICEKDGEECLVVKKSSVTALLTSFVEAIQKDGGY